MRYIIFSRILFAIIIFLSCKNQTDDKSVSKSIPDQQKTISSFPFSFYSTANSGNEDNCLIILKEMQQNGVTMIGPYYGHNITQCFKSASKLGMKAIYRIDLIGQDNKNPINFTSTPINDAPNYAEIKQQVKTTIQNIVNDPDLNNAVAWWAVSPEELRYWRKNEMNYLTNLKKAILEVENELNLKHRLLMMYEPNNRKAADLVNIGKYGLDVQMRGVYGNGIDDPNWPNIIEFGTQAVYQSSNDLKNLGGVTLNLNKDYSSSLNEEQAKSLIRVAAYVALINGAKGIQIWSWATRAGLSKENRDKQVAAYMSVSNDLNGKLHLANIFMQGHKNQDKSLFTITSGTATENLKFELWDYNNSKYLFLINTSLNKKVSINSLLNLNFQKNEFIEGFSNNTFKMQSNNTFSLDIDPLSIIILKFS
ncbi:hypothetical protein QEJ31_05955 [Pigmentibacter sp. JX0631]|uniref:hypothetical protein n=1 Tax=Pigmentibacter sp. JX0631 TaxID=2976982 RepID=UPI002469B933|nr:hypothetical protein [Pigmentibacter sp. JX0631]WGL61139.1 hypothetical protein QEJ31_05955 [Pigmentibacter sp. JX0631]